MVLFKSLKEPQLSIDEKFDEMKQGNQSVVKQLQEQIIQVKQEFNKRMDGLTNEVEVTQNVKKDYWWQVQKGEKRYGKRNI